jgi:hypothetical protein
MHAVTMRSLVFSTLELLVATGVFGCMANVLNAKTSESVFEVAATAGQSECMHVSKIINIY